MELRFSSGNYHIRALANIDFFFTSSTSWYTISDAEHYIEFDWVASTLMQWNTEQQVWESQIQHPNELPEVLKEVMKVSGYGCLAVEADIGIVHVCYAPDRDIGGFTDKPVINRWQLIKMPTAPLIRLELIILDHLESPFRFESFLNVAEEDQAKILAQLANQNQLFLAFYGDDLSYRYTKIVALDGQKWQLIDELTEEASRYWELIPLEERDFDKAKAKFMEKF